MVFLGLPPTRPPVRPAREASTSLGSRAVLANRPFLVLVACNVLFTLALSLLSTGLPLYITETLNLSTVMLGILSAFGAGLLIETQTLVMRLLEPYRRTRSLALVSLLRALGYALLALALLLPYLFGVVALNTLASMITAPTVIALAAASSPAHLHKNSEGCSGKKRLVPSFRPLMCVSCLSAGEPHTRETVDGKMPSG